MATKTKAVAPTLRTNKYNLEKFKTDVLGWCLILPALAIICFYTIWPMIGAIQLAFSKTKGFTVVEFCGFNNFKDVLKHPNFIQALKNSVLYTIWSLIIGLLVPVVIAALTAETTHGRGFFRIAMRLPGILPSIASLLILTFFFRSDKLGFLNGIFINWGWEPYPFLTNKDTIIFWLIVCATWSGAGGTSLLYMAAMSDISPELYEAAALDGASPWKRFQNITWPAIQGQFQLLLILQIIGVFQIMYQPMVMTGGGPNNASLSLMLLVYRYTYMEMRLGHAGALSLIVSVFLILLSIVRYFWQKHLDEKNG